MTRAIDPRALSILFARYWSARGWKPEGARDVSPSDLAHARAHGLMFDDVTLDHDACIAWMRSAVEGVTEARVVDAFVASLGSRRLDLRSALASWVRARWLSAHGAAPIDGWCDVCGLYPSATHDLSILSFERHKWGGVRHDEPAYVALDLQSLAREPPPTPTPEDRAILAAVLDAARTSARDGTHTALSGALAKVVRGNQAERGVLLEVLARCGVLEDPEHPGFADRGMTSREIERARRPAAKSDLGYPLDWWRGRGRVNERNVERWFGRTLEMRLVGG